jgi:PAS domain S-box-containing protein
MSPVVLPEISSEASLAHLGESFETFGRIVGDLERAYEGMRQRAERIDHELAETNRRLAAILASLPVGVVVTDEHDRITHLNATAESILGVAESDVTGRPAESLRAAAGEAVLEADGSIPAPDVREIEAAAGHRLVRVADADVTLPDGVPGGRILTIEDVTEAEELRREVHRLDKMAALGEMSARLAHQIRNPLNGMQGFAGLLHRGLADRPAQRSHAQKVLDGARDLNRIVTNMLTFSRPSRRVPEPCSLAQTAQAAVEWIRDQIPAGGRVRLTVRHDTPAAAVLADRFPLEEALRNLLSNAVEAVGDEGVVRVRTRVRDGRGEVSVFDSGPGVLPDIAEQIFEPFVTGRERGTGLGLAIVRSVVEQAGGDLALRPTGRGARFRLRLNLANPGEPS